MIDSDPRSSSPISHESRKDMQMKEEFIKILKEKQPEGRQKEQVIQDFMEEHSQFLPTPGLLNHGLHFNAIISKYPISVNYKSDYAYITKSSVKWKVYFVELENPEKRIFKSRKGRIEFTADFNSAIDQIRSWRVELEKASEDIMRRLKLLFKPDNISDNRTDFGFVLVYGRNGEYANDPGKRATIDDKSKREDIEIKTYDSILSGMENTEAVVEKNVMRYGNLKYGFKHLHRDPRHMLSFLGSSVIEFTDEQISVLNGWGYDMNVWKSGSLLSFDGKTAALSPNDIADHVLKSLESKNEREL